ncbi:MAG: hypothetical protein ACE5F7_05070 [Nitrospiria bacterium]
MIRSKTFIITLVVGLIGVAAYNIHFFFLKDREGDAAVESGFVQAGFSDMDDETMPDSGEAGGEGPNVAPGNGSVQTEARPPVKLILIEQLSQKRDAVRLKEGDRDPFSVQGKRRRAAARSAKKAQPETGLSPDRIKMIYIDNETAFAWVDGKRWQKGEMIGGERLVGIRENAVFLEKRGDVREVRVMPARASAKGINIDYEK